MDLCYTLFCKDKGAFMLDIKERERIVRLHITRLPEGV